MVAIQYLELLRMEKEVLDSLGCELDYGKVKFSLLFG